MSKFDSLPVEVDLGNLPSNAVHSTNFAIAKAYQLLNDTDYVVIKALEQNIQLSYVWLTWRESLREVIRGNSNIITAEPNRYV